MPIRLTCEVCGIGFSVKPYRAEQKTCSHKCADKAKTGQKQPRKIGWVERFDGYVMPEPNSGCWIWIGALESGGYGLFHHSYPKRHHEKAHRVSYERFVGAIPDGLVIDHKCRTRCCVNPAHLEVVTHAENIRRGLTGENMRSKTHCPRGHEYNEENTQRRNGRRHCRACYDTVYRPRKNERRRVSHAAT